MSRSFKLRLKLGNGVNDSSNLPRIETKFQTIETIVPRWWLKPRFSPDGWECRSPSYKSHRDVTSVGEINHAAHTSFGGPSWKSNWKAARTTNRRLIQLHAQEGSPIFSSFFSPSFCILSLASTCLSPALWTLVVVVVVVVVVCESPSFLTQPRQRALDSLFVTSFSLSLSLSLCRVTENIQMRRDSSFVEKKFGGKKVKLRETFEKE